MDPYAKYSCQYCYEKVFPKYYVNQQSLHNEVLKMPYLLIR